MTNQYSLGRKPSPPDARDFNLADYLDTPDPKPFGQVVAPTTTTPLDSAFAALLADRGANHSVKAWAGEVMLILEPTPNPTPTPTPTNTDVSWAISTILDQGQTPHCVGFGWTDWANSKPVELSLTDADANALYYDCKVIDGEPGQEDGSTVRSGAKASQNLKRLNAYAFGTLAVADTWVRSKGVIVVGSDWTNDMFNPDANGYVAPTGGVAGGHCYILDEVLDSEDAYGFTNSWGTSWGLGGKFKMKKADFSTLLQSNGELCASVELPA